MLLASPLQHRDRTPDQQSMKWAEDFILNIQQDGRPLERYVEEFLSVVHLVSWSDHMVNACFRMGLDDDSLFRFLSTDDCYRPVVNFIN